MGKNELRKFKIKIKKKKYKNYSFYVDVEFANAFFFYVFKVYNKRKICRTSGVSLKGKKTCDK